ncbi:dynein regulatory complex protein 1 isoform X4 [Narcine bancroftii]|uniref:dynein regulatory complex protein 1 isoform X4 n=1 Tax=Narcine bancroftii TaxID=1343680 RepID=UPI00383215C1
MASAKDELQPAPSVNSEDPEERIAARRLRIARRQEERRREARGEDEVAEGGDDKDELSKSCKQVVDSCQRLLKLKRDGLSLVTNVQVAEDSREMQRRNVEREAQRQRSAKLENEAIMSEEKFEAITKKWLSAKALKIPQDLRDVLLKQQQLCAQLIEGKNKLINTLQKELKLSDDRYVKDLKKSAEDIDLLLERMEEQIKTLTKSYRMEMIEIEKAFQLERHELKTKYLLMWEKKMQTRRDKEIEYFVVRMKKVEEYEDQLQKVQSQDEEEYDMIKMKLLTDVEILEQQLEQMKATYQLNQEKLEYNFQVLKKRDEENMITKSQQKRKIARHFASVDAKKFEGIWLMNEEEAKDLVRKVLDADRIIHQQQLGLNWTMPELYFMKNVGPIVSCTGEKKSAVQMVEEVILGGKQPWDLQEGEGKEEKSLMQNSIFQNICYSASEDKAMTLCGGRPGELSLKTVKTLLEVLCDETGFLIESKLIKIIDSLKRDERSLIQLDAIFAALGIENEDDIIKLTEFFIKNCEMSKNELDKEIDVLLQYLDEEVLEKRKAEEDGLEVKVCINEDEAQKDKACAELLSQQRFHLVHPNDILRILRLFLEDHQQARGKTKAKTSTVKERDNSEDGAYWNAMTKVIPESRLRVWNYLEDALTKYFQILVKRTNLNSEKCSLAQQNAEFRLLLQQYICSTVSDLLCTVLHFFLHIFKLDMQKEHP